LRPGGGFKALSGSNTNQANGITEISHGAIADDDTSLSASKGGVGSGQNMRGSKQLFFKKSNNLNGN
jgi:hypothetical protein